MRVNKAVLPKNGISRFARDCNAGEQVFQGALQKSVLGRQ
jgi:hypothetical protein